jgi:signal transduction histidine kinase
MGHSVPSPIAVGRPSPHWPPRLRRAARQAVPTPAPGRAAERRSHWTARATRTDLVARAVCLLTGFGLAYLTFGTSTSSTGAAALVAVAIVVLLAVFAGLPTPRSMRGSHLAEPDQLESAVLFSTARAGATAVERQRIARDIHDGIAQEVASLGYLVDELACAQDDPEHRSGLLDVRTALGRILSGLRLTVADLRGGSTDADRLGPALTDYALAVGKRSSMVVHLAIEEAPQRLSPGVETELLRIAQEAVTNAGRHASAGNLWVTASLEPPFATISVDDDGVGSAAPRPDHFGLQIMQERAERIGAVLAIDERPEGGTRVRAVLRPRESPESDLELGGSDALQRASDR